uniref:SFRICE_022584 n=1 Tax=Spodoptera frugiperda TaxID=7108 RepID=A0A2H1V7D7_SPOFR
MWKLVTCLNMLWFATCRPHLHHTDPITGRRTTGRPITGHHMLDHMGHPITVHLITMDLPTIAHRITARPIITDHPTTMDHPITMDHTTMDHTIMDHIGPARS